MGFLKSVKVAALAAAIALPGAALAEWKPAGPVTFEVGFGAGGSTDTLARAIASAMEDQTGWDVIVENKPGGGGVAMFSGLVKAKPNGQRIGMGVTLATQVNLAERGDKLPFKIDSFDYLATVVLSPLALVAPADAPYNNFKELVAFSKENGGALIGFDAGPQRMMMLAVNKTAESGFELVSNQSGAETMQGLLGGQLQAGFGAGEQIPYLESGDVKMLAVATQTRQDYSPDTESFIEQGFAYSVEPYFYIAAPKGLDPEAKAALAAALDAAVNSPKAAEVITNIMKTKPINLGPEGTAEKIAAGLAEVQNMMKLGAN